MITWVINNKCNFHCNYCTQWQNNPESIEPINLSDLSDSLDILEKGWLFHITGGEPFLESNFVDICQVITKRHYLSMNTNLSTTNVFDFANKIDPNKTLFVCSSVHIAEREKKDIKLSSYINKVLYLQNRGFNIISSYVAHPTLLGRIISDITFLKSNGINNVRIKIYRGVFDGKYYPNSFNSYEKAFLESMDADYPEFEILNRSNSYYGQLCRAGQGFFVMARNGDLGRCSSSPRTYGNLFKKTTSSDIKARPCPLKKCGCPYEGIRNVLPEDGSVHSLIIEDIKHKYLKSKRIIRRIIENPKLLRKIKDKILE